MNTTTTVFYRVIAAFVLAVILVSFGGVSVGHADPGYAPTTSVAVPAQHPLFPNQDNAPQPGTQTHHDHQNNHG